MKILGSRFHAIACALVLAALLALPAPAAAFPSYNYGIKSGACGNVETDLPACQDGGGETIRESCVSIVIGPPPDVVFWCTFTADAPSGSANAGADHGGQGDWRLHAELAVNETTPLFDRLSIATHADEENGTSLEYDTRLTLPSTPEPRYRTPVIQTSDT